MIRQRIQEDLKQALKLQEKEKILVLRGFLAALLNKEKEKRYQISKETPGLEEKELQEKSQLGEEEIVDLLFSEVKKRREAIEDFKKGGRQDLVEKEEGEIEKLKKYLPELVSEEEIRKKALEVIEKQKAESLKDTGRVMNQLMSELKGRADGGLVARMVKELLEKD